MLGTVLSNLDILMHWTFIVPLLAKFHYFTKFTEEEAKAQKG